MGEVKRKGKERSYSNSLSEREIEIGGEGQREGKGRGSEQREGRGNE